MLLGFRPKVSSWHKRRYFYLFYPTAFHFGVVATTMPLKEQGSFKMMRFVQSAASIEASRSRNSTRSSTFSRWTNCRKSRSVLLRVKSHVSLRCPRMRSSSIQSPRSAVVSTPDNLLSSISQTDFRPPVSHAPTPQNMGFDPEEHPVPPLQKEAYCRFKENYQKQKTVVNDNQYNCHV